MSFEAQMQTAALDGGVELSYFDSWKDRADRPSSHTTLLGIHGVTFNAREQTSPVYSYSLAASDASLSPAGAFQPLIAHLPANVRLLAYSQRLYAGSSAPVVSDKEGKTDATAAYLVDMLNFIDFAVDNLGCAPVGTDGKGGIVLVVSGEGPSR